MRLRAHLCLGEFGPSKYKTGLLALALLAVAGCSAKEPEIARKPIEPAVVVDPGISMRPQIPARQVAIRPDVAPMSSAGSNQTPSVFSTPTPSVRVVNFDQLTGWHAGDHAPALAAFVAACENLGTDATKESIGGMDMLGAPLFGTLADWEPICAAAASTPPSQAKALFERAFLPVSVKRAGEGDALFTAYFEPELNGSRRRGGPYQTPIYAKPSDLAVRSPYYSRAEIATGAIAGRGLELFWIDDAVEAFFLEIQGSGRIRLPDGSVTRVGFAGKNGHPYKSVGKTLIEWSQMELSGVSVRTIKDWVAANPQRMQALFNTNPSTVFFTERVELARNPSLGPIGSLGVPIFAQRSVAIDRSYYPLGAPMWVEFDTPLGRMSHLTVAMDTGGAIKGAGRADYFFGSGDEAGEVAGSTRSEGRLIAFAPRSAIARLLRAGT